MKRFVAIALLAGMISVGTGCYGSFSLTKKIYSWNGTVGDKYINSGVFLLFTFVVPVYEVCGFVDAVALNVIEFWLGSNPLALQSDKEIHRTVSNGGKTYEVTAGKGAITILETKGPDAGKKITMRFNAESAQWALIDGSGNATVVATINPRPINTVSLISPDGTVTDQPLN
ncbi:MAG: DUF3332 domain-containing protein [Chitinispirillaceae bacterium]|jgi:hypothetical protein|nr:DUF3332 domain-containing protein [Chitinispirillaceae bacterium]